MKENYISTTILKYLNESIKYNDFMVIFKDDRYVSHITSESNAINIIKNGFKTGKELNVAEKRSAIFFSDSGVNYGLYSRNKQGEAYEGENVGEVIVNLKDLKLLNMTYKHKGEFVNYNKYKTFNVKGKLEKIPYDIDGTISFLEDGNIYEVALKKDVANKVIVGKK